MYWINVPKIMYFPLSSSDSEIDFKVRPKEQLEMQDSVMFKPI